MPSDGLIVADKTLETDVENTSDEDSTEITEAFITDDGRVVSVDDVMKQVLRKSMRGLDERIHDEVNNDPRFDVTKSVDGSTQSDEPLDSEGLETHRVVSPPYPPEVLAKFLETDEVHFRCVR